MGKVEKSGAGQEVTEAKLQRELQITNGGRGLLKQVASDEWRAIDKWAWPLGKAIPGQ